MCNKFLTSLQTAAMYLRLCLNCQLEDFLFFLLHCTFTAFNKVCVKSFIVNRITGILEQNKYYNVFQAFCF